MALNADYDQDALQLAAAQSLTGTGNFGTAVDVRTHKGKMKFVVNHAGITDTDSGASPTATFKLRTSGTTGGTFTDVTGGGLTAVSTSAAGLLSTIVDLDNCNRFVKPFVTIVETNATILASSEGIFKQSGM
jgi:hypothetical protein